MAPNIYSSRTSPVLLAVLNGDSELLRAALRRSLASTPVSSSELSDALYEAVHRKRADCVRLLLDAGADPCVASSRTDRLAIFRAAQDENWPLVEMLAQPPAKQSFQERESAPLATDLGSVRTGVRCNRATENGSTVLHWACRRGAPRSTLQCLIAVGCDINARAKDGGLTPLMLAVQSRSYAALGELIAAGCKLDARSGQGQTALLMASNTGFCVSPLLDAGADASLADDAGNTALIAATSEGLCAVVALLCAALRGRSDGGAAIDSRNAAGLAALHIAASKGHAECVEAIVGAGGDPALTDADGGTAAYHAVGAGGCRGADTIACLARMTPRFGEQLASSAAAAAAARRCPLRRAAEGGHAAVLATLLLVSGDAISAAATALLWRQHGRQQQARLPLWQPEHALRDRSDETEAAAGSEVRLEQLLEQCAGWCERRVPRDLKSLCRERVRRCLGRAVLLPIVRRLPLPPALQDYVAMLRADSW